MAIRWVDAPPPARPGRKKAVKLPKYAKEAAQFRKNPGSWGVLADDASTALAWQIANGKVAAFKDGRWEAVSRALPASKHGRGQIYVRYIGPDEDES